MVLSSINIYKYMICGSNSEFIDVLMTDINNTLLEVLFKTNNNIKNKKELYFGNAKIVFDTSKKIATTIKNELFSMNIKLPINDKVDKFELANKLNAIIAKAITISGIATYSKSVDQVICI